MKYMTFLLGNLNGKFLAFALRKATRGPVPDVHETKEIAMKLRKRSALPSKARNKLH